MPDNRAARAQEFASRSVNEFQSGKFHEAVALLDKGLAALGKGPLTKGEKYLYSNILHQKFVFYEFAQDDKAAKITAEESLKFDEHLKYDSIEMQAMADVNAAYKHAYLGNFSKALEHADKVDVDSPKIIASDIKGLLLSRLSLIYSKAQSGAFSERYEKITLKLISVYEKDRERNAKLIVECCQALNQARCKNGNTSAARPLREKAWALRQDFGLENVEIQTLLNLCLGGITEGEMDERANWSRNALECIDALLDQMDLTPQMATVYLASNLHIFISNPCNDFITLNPLNFLPVIEDFLHGEQSDLVAYEYWLVGSWLSRSAGWSTANGRKAFRLLRKALRMFKNQSDVPSAIYAHALGLVADAHLAQGQSALAADEFAEAESIYSTMYGKDHPLSAQYQDGLKKAQA
jgi:tetratricopeptide (TPR) repeat protein